MHQKAIELIQDASSVIIIQAENPDGDSLGSSLFLEEVLSEMGKKVTMYCPVDIPKYMRYFPGWDRVVQQFDTKHDLAIIVDTTSETLISKVLSAPGVRHYLETHEVLVIDHHTQVESTLPFDHTLLLEEGASTSEVLTRLADSANWSIPAQGAEHALGALLSDTLGLTTQSVTSDSYEVAARLTELGAHPSAVEGRRREFMKKAPEILSYKGRLIERIEYYLDGKLALVNIPFEEIEAYSDQYNPSALVIDEMRLVEGVEVAIAIKTYPDGKLTGKIRSNIPISSDIAGFFGGGGHPYAAGFRVYETPEQVLRELIEATNKALNV